jgi:NAD(P)-dependent dehydrogenase (short-subunit alcohol dehydrogenase family)
MENRIAIVTGAYGAIGKAIARGMASEGYHTVLVGRDEEKLKMLVQELTVLTNNEKISHQAVDLSRKSEIASFAQSWKGPLHILINNAATTPRTRQETPEGIELQFATNVLGYFWMTQYFHPFMANQSDARIVNVASYWAGDLDLDDLEFKRRPYNNDTAYRQTKQANRMLSLAFAKRLHNLGITVLAAHPGDVNSKLSNNLGYGGMATPDEGATTPLFCALSPGLKGVSGKYYENQSETPCRFIKDVEEVEQLWEICEGYSNT